MNILIPIIVLIILAVVYAGSLHNSKSRLYVIITVLCFILLVCWIQLYCNNNTYINNNMQNVNSIEKFQHSGYAPLNYKLRLNNNASDCSNNNYININNQLSPLGTYDGLILPNKLTSAPLHNKVFITNPDGDDIQLTQDLSSQNFPSVDGTINGDKHLFVFANNNANINCKSQYSTSTGQVCLSPEQIKMFSGRNA